MKVSFIIGHDNREFLRKALKHEFYTKNCKKYTKKIRERIFEMDYYADADMMTTYKAANKYMMKLMHEFIGEKGNIVVGLERYIKDKASWFVISVIDSYYRTYYPENYTD